MKRVLKKIPIWIKEPIYVFYSEFNKLPVKAAYHHAVCNYADNRDVSVEDSKRIYKKRQKYIYSYLLKRYKRVLDDLEYSPGIKVINAPIWVFWWQGEDEAPELVKNCIKSVKQYAGNHPVYIISKENYLQFTDIPRYIIEKLEDGKISLTHFSDILRMNLIAYNGGCWLDATVFCSQKITEVVFDNPIYTGRNPGNDYKNISNWNWTGFAIAGWKSNSLFVAANAIFNAYWNENDVLIDYYLIDYVLRIVYENMPEVKSTISQIEPNNTKQMLLCQNLNRPYSVDRYKNIVADATWLHKLSWKEKWIEKTPQGEKTMYAYWKEQVEEKYEIFNNCTNF